MSKRDDSWFWLAFAVALFLLACVAVDILEPVAVEEPIASPKVETPVVLTVKETIQEPEEPEEPSWYIEALPLTYEEQEALWEACQEFQVDHAVMLALIERETDFRNIQGDGGDSIGYCQIQPRWWSGLMEEIGAEDLTDPEDNFRTACAIMAQLTERYGNVEDALSAYNTGSAGSTKYASAVLSNSAKWEVAR